MGSAFSTISRPCPACVDAALGREELVAELQWGYPASRHRDATLTHSCELVDEGARHAARRGTTGQVSAERRMEEGRCCGEHEIEGFGVQDARESARCYSTWSPVGDLIRPDINLADVDPSLFVIGNDEEEDDDGNSSNTNENAQASGYEPYIDEVALLADSCERISPDLGQVHSVGYQETQPGSSQPPPSLSWQVDGDGYRKTQAMSSQAFSLFPQIDCNGNQETQPMFTELAPRKGQDTHTPETLHCFITADDPSVV